MGEDVVYCAVSPMENNQILFGRPYGGVALLWHSQSACAVFPLSSVSDGIVAVQVKADHGAILVIAVYLPVNYGDSASFDDFITELGYLDGLLESEMYDHVIVMGDFNIDLRRREGKFSVSLRS